MEDTEGGMDSRPQLAQIVDSRDYPAVLGAVIGVYDMHYTAGAVEIRACYRHVELLFSGRFPGYRRCLVQYHDFRHTMDVVLATARLLDGQNLNGPPLEAALARSLLLAALLHDTGYIQEQWDTEGTGARYTTEHEQRSIEFTARNAETLGIPAAELPVLERLILATSLRMDFAAIPYASQPERTAGAILGTADIIAQMADREYLEKLLFLYYEFQEAGMPGYDTEFDILRKTRGFYEATRRRLEETLMGVHGLATAHFGERWSRPENLYVEAIERQMAYLDRIIADETTNFRHKLHRGDQEKLHSGVTA